MEKPIAPSSSSSSSIDPKIVAVMRASKPPKVAYVWPIIKIVAFLSYFVPSTIILFPIMLLRNWNPSLRANPAWSFQTAMTVTFLRRVIRNFCRFRFQPITPRQGGWREMDNWLGMLLGLFAFTGPGGYAARNSQNGQRTDRVWFQPAGPEYLTGGLTIQTENVEKGWVDSPNYKGPPILEAKWTRYNIRAFWFMHKAGLPSPSSLSPNPTCRDRPVLLYFHGGAGVTFNAGDIFVGRTLTKTMANCLGVDIFSVDYNLAPFAPSPVPHYQAVSAYLYLTKQLGYRANQILIGGDSYGGHLTLMLERYLRLHRNLFLTQSEMDSQKNHLEPVAAGLLLLSAYLAGDGDHFLSRNTLINQDIVVPAYPQWSHLALQIGPLFHHRHPLPLSDPWFTFTNLSDDELSQLPPTFIANGGSEVLVDENEYFVFRLRNAKNLPHQPKPTNPTLSTHQLDQDVVWHVYPHLPHDYFTMDGEMAKSKHTYQQMATWIHQHLFGKNKHPQTTLNVETK